MSDNPYMISFSGGRTSAMMTEELLKDESYKCDSIICFCNTGLEDEETLVFVNKCTQRWQEIYQKQVIWLEFCRREEKPDFKIVNFDTASRKGEPFAALLEWRNNLPNIVARYCTQELKVRTIKRYMLSLGIDYWTNVVGIRYDEPGRWSRAGNIASKERFDIALPLVRWKITKPDVLAYWSKMPFDLMIENEIFGNCVLCMLKGKGKKKQILRRRPAAADFWLHWEQERKGYTFCSRYSIEQLISEVQRSPELFDELSDPDIDCLCTVD
jgi:3'-phosphoadenosine 5'-phosphosulfate sulfotransferase (PAPS reductase)/FAD synthetase